MGDNPKKYHITDEGVIYRVDDTGEITELGNVDSLGQTQNTTVNNEDTTQEVNIRYSLSEMERSLINGKGKGLNRHERKHLVLNSSNVSALEAFVKFCGYDWVKVLVNRYQRGETFLEPVLLKAIDIPASSWLSYYVERYEKGINSFEPIIFKAAKNQIGEMSIIASCKRKYSDTSIYHILYNLNDPSVIEALKANPISPYYEPYFVPMPEKSGGCFGVILLFIISTATIITNLI